MSIFTSSFALRAAIVVLAVGFAAPVAGTFLVQRRLALIGDGIGHLAFAGVALGLALGISPIYGALTVSLLGAFALERLRIAGRVPSDLSLALIFFTGIASGAVGLSLLNRFDASAIGVLFGSVLTASWKEVGVVVVMCGLVVLVLLTFYRQLLAISLDEETARGTGLQVDRFNLILVIVTAVLVAAGMRAVGLLLISALLVVPVAAGSRLAHSFRATMVWACLIGPLSCLVGLGAALAQGKVAPGGSMVMASIMAFLVAAIIGRRAARSHPGGRI